MEQFSRVLTRGGYHPPFLNQTPVSGMLERYFADVIEVYRLLICSKLVILGSLDGPDSDSGRALVTEEDGPPMSTSVSLCQGLWPAFRLWTCLACPRPLSQSLPTNLILPLTG